MSGYRATGRHHAHQKVGVRAGDSLERDAWLENVGLEGARLRLTDAPTVGTVLRLRIDTATAWEALQLDAVVRWTGARERNGAHASSAQATGSDEAHDETQVGVEFAPLEPRAAVALAEWLATLRYDDGMRPRG